MKKGQFVVLVFAIFVGVLVSGCATIFKGSSQKIVINSTPAEANISIKNNGGVEVFTGKTPSTVKLSKKHEYVVTIQLKGYKESVIQVTQTLEGWFLGNILCGGVVGIIIDAVDGAMWDLEPENIQVSLTTAYLNGTETQTYAIFKALDNQGQLRTLAVPLIKDNTLAIK